MYISTNFWSDFYFYFLKNLILMMAIKLTQIAYQRELFQIEIVLKLQLCSE